MKQNIEAQMAWIDYYHRVKRTGDFDEEQLKRAVVKRLFNSSDLRLLAFVSLGVGAELGAI